MRRPRSSPIPSVVALALALGLVASACTGGGAAAPDSGPTATGPLLPSTPDALPTFDVGAFRTLLDQLHGTPVVVNVWGSWCPPCIAEAPALSKLARETRGKVQFVGIDILDQRAPAVAFIHRYGWIYPSVFDPPGRIRDGLGFIGQPVTAVYDASGKQVFAWSGPISDDVLRTELRTLHVI
jgi:thiol-disulfide isomerase/thioredoxin